MKYLVSTLLFSLRRETVKRCPVVRMDTLGGRVWPRFNIGVPQKECLVRRNLSETRRLSFHICVRM
jgi:hypothetical protein